MGEERQKKENRMAVLASVQGHDSTVAHAFNHTDGKCPKCGTDQHMLMFCLPGQTVLPRVRGCELDVEHIHRMCAGCKYPWVERCLDQLVLAQEEGWTVAESEIASALAAFAHRAQGLSLERTIVSSYKGWIIRFKRDQERGTLEITSEPPKPQRGEVVHPEPPQGPQGGAA